MYIQCCHPNLPNETACKPLDGVGSPHVVQSITLPKWQKFQAQPFTIVLMATGGLRVVTL